MKSWFISDLHLKSLNERNGNILLRFLFSIINKENTATHLFLLGDIFDFWVGDHEIYKLKFKALVEALLQIKKMGIEIVYIEGNHDVHVAEFWKKNGILTFVEDQYYKLGPWSVRVSHGDLINPDDKAYLQYRHFIRQPIMQKVAQLIPAKQLMAIGEWASRTSRKKSKVRRQNESEKLKQMIHQYAQVCYSEKAFDFLISGHMHIKDEWSALQDGKKFTSINLGSWFEQPAALWLDDKGTGWLELA